MKGEDRGRRRGEEERGAEVSEHRAHERKRKFEERDETRTEHRMIGWI